MATQNPIPVYFNPEIGPNYKGLSFEDIANSFNNGQQFSNQIQQQQQKGILARLIAQNTGADGQVDLNKSLQSVQTNPNQSYQPEMVNTLSGMIQQKKIADLKAQQDAIKFNADTNKTNAETGKLYQESGEKKIGNTQKGQTLLSNLIATSTDATDAAKKLEILGSQYGLPPETIEATKAQLSDLAANNQGGSDAFENIRKSYGLLGASDPIKYLTPEANTVANNATSIETTRMTSDATKRGQDITAETANKDRIQKQSQFTEEQKLADWIAKNKPIDEFTAPDGTRYNVYPGGKGIAVSDKNGTVLKSQVKGSETQIQKAERIEKALGYEDAAKSAAGASTLAAKLANDLKGLNSTAGGFGILAKVPGSPQKTFASQIETLQSQVFLNQIAKMRGLGALTDAEGQRLATSIANLDINLDPITLQANLSEISKIMSGAAVKASKLAKLHANPNGVQQSQSQQNLGSSQSMATSMTEVRQAAQQMGMGVQDAVNMFKAQGVNIQ